MSAENSPIEGRHYVFREPTVTEDAGLWAMAHGCQGLDFESSHSASMRAGHFADSCVIAERHHKPAGFVSAFVRPAAPDTVLVWQISVAESERGQGLGRKLLHHLLSRPVCRRVEILEAPVTRSNRASRALFEALARDLDVPFEAGQGLESKLLPDGIDDSEDLVRIGPLIVGGT